MTTLIPSLVPDYDCIVIGAGLSGLSAATTLLTKDPDLKVLVLEAQAEVGGRTKSDKSTFTVDGAPFAVDLGANWFHGLTGGEHSGVSPVAPGNPLKPIADEIDLPYTFTDWDNSFTYQGGEKQTQAELDASYKAYEEFAEEGSAFVKNLNADQSLAKTLESILNDDGWKPYKDAVNRFLYSEKIAGAAAAPALLSSNLLLDEAWLEGGDYLVRDFGAIAVHLADQVSKYTTRMQCERGGGKNESASAFWRTTRTNTRRTHDEHTKPPLQNARPSFVTSCVQALCVCVLP